MTATGVSPTCNTRFVRKDFASNAVVDRREPKSTFRPPTLNRHRANLNGADGGVHDAKCSGTGVGADRGADLIGDDLAVWDLCVESNPDLLGDFGVGGMPDADA